MRPPPVTWRCAGVFVAALTFGCGDDESSKTEERLDSAVARLATIAAPGQDGWKAGNDVTCVEPGSDADATLLVTLKLSNFALRPRFGCGDLTQCGFVEISLIDAAGDLVLQRQAAASTINLPFATLEQPEGRFAFEARLLNEAGELFTLADSGVPCGGDSQCRHELDVRRVCNPVADADTPEDASQTPEHDASSDRDAGLVDMDAGQTQDAAATSDAGLDASL